MKSTSIMTSAFCCILIGCGSPPKPPQVTGDYRPVNKIPTKLTEIPAVSKTANGPQPFDFSFDGDIAASLEALRAVQPQLTVLPPHGTPVPWKVRVHLKNTTIDEVVRNLGSQGASVANIVTTGSDAGTNQAYVCFSDADDYQSTRSLMHRLKLLPSSK